MNISEIINQLGEERDHYFNAMSPPIIQTSNYRFKTVADLKKGLENEFEEPVYSRGNNPTVEILRKKMAALEEMEDALILSSGVAAISVAVIANVKAGDHVICVKNTYSWTKILFEKFLPRFHVETTFVDGINSENFEKAVKPNTKMIFLESPSTFLFEVQDIEAVVAIAKKHSLLTIMENTYATPLYQKPATYGVDIILHTASKYLGGHSDIIAGVICSDSKMIRKIFDNEFLTLGSVISPNDAWLILRGLRTLHIRLEHISTSTEKIISYLQNHPKIEKILYPFADKSPQIELAKKQMKRCGGLFSVIVKDMTHAQIETFCNALKLFNLGVSWGGHESLVLPACVLMEKQNNIKPDYPDNLIRFYIGLEQTEDLIEDLKTAFSSI